MDFPADRFEVGCSGPRSCWLQLDLLLAAGQSNETQIVRVRLRACPVAKGFTRSNTSW